MVISATVITAGRATAVVCATGMDTEVGRIAGLLLDSEGGGHPPPAADGGDFQDSVLRCACACAR